jgi:hypothetical protein
MSFSSNNRWEQEVSKLKFYVEDGYTNIQLARMYNVSTQRIAQVLKKYKLSKVAQKNRMNKKAAEFAERWGQKADTDLYRVQREKYRNKKAACKGKGEDFTIPFGDLYWPVHCPVLGIELNYFAESRQENSVSFDKIVPSRGYCRGNTVIISWRAKRIKNDGTADEHKKIALYINRYTQTL